MKKIIDYQTVERSDSNEFNDAIVAGIAAGWQPYGSLQVVTLIAHDKYNYVLVQAMVRYEENN